MNNVLLHVDCLLNKLVPFGLVIDTHHEQIGIPLPLTFKLMVCELEPVKVRWACCPGTVVCMVADPVVSRLAVGSGGTS